MVVQVLIKRYVSRDYSHSEIEVNQQQGHNNRFHYQLKYYISSNNAQPFLYNQNAAKMVKIRDKGAQD